MKTSLCHGGLYNSNSDWEKKKSVLCLFLEWSPVIFREDHPYPSCQLPEAQLALNSDMCSYPTAVPEHPEHFLNLSGFFFFLPTRQLPTWRGPRISCARVKNHLTPAYVFFFFPLLYELGFKSWPWFSEKIKLGHSQCLICIHSYEFCNLEDVSNPGKCNHEPTAKQFPKRPFQGMDFKCPRSSVQRQRYLKYTQTYKPFR